MTLAAWTPRDAAQPELRIGIVLPEDRRTSISFSGPASGVVVEGLRAGRGFHWEKSINQRLPGVLEVRPAGGALLVVCRLPIEEYLVGVITSEMSGECPIEFLKAQCVVARSWTLANTEKKHAELGIDYCNDDCCQRFQGLEGATEAARRAVADTVGEVLLTQDGLVVDANYSKSCGGIVEDPRHVWPDRAKPGLSALVDAPAESPIRERFDPLDESNLREFLDGAWLASCDAYCGDQTVPPAIIGRYLGRVDTPEGFFRWRVSYSRSELEALLSRKVFERLGTPERERPARLDRIRVIRRGVSGRATEIALDYVDRAGAARSFSLADQYWIRHALHESFLYSSAIMVEEQRESGGGLARVTLVGAGWGHGAGFCQIGALGMSLKGYDYRAILGHYFPGTRLEKLYSVSS